MLVIVVPPLFGFLIDEGHVVRRFRLAAIMLVLSIFTVAATRRIHHGRMEHQPCPPSPRRSRSHHDRGARCRGAFGRLPECVRPAGEADGYAVQDEVIRQREAVGQALAGWKIGCTVTVMQDLPGLDSPSGGAVPVPATFASPAHVDAAKLTNPVAEYERAVRIARDVEPRDGGHDQDSIAAHVGTCMTSIALAELRLPQREEMNVGELIADDSFQKAVVIGPEIGSWRDLDLATVNATTTVSGVHCGDGKGGDIMGHPFAALAWLANALAEGQIVLTGSMVKAAPIAKGDTVTCAIEGLGAISLTFD